MMVTRGCDTTTICSYGHRMVKLMASVTTGCNLNTIYESLSIAKLYLMDFALIIYITLKKFGEWSNYD